MALRVQPCMVCQYWHHLPALYCSHNITTHAECACKRLVLQAAQIQLDRAAQDFRQLHQERQDLIRQWDEARDAMKSRDEAIQVSTPQA